MNAFASSAVAQEVQIVRGQAAKKLLNDPGFQREWKQLAAACRWATGSQTWEFADAWYGAYERLYEPLLLFQCNSQGQLIGLLPLAVGVASNVLVHVGAHQAEYQVWIANEAFSDNFIEQALNVLQAHYPRRRLRLTYLPGGVPLGWRASGRRWRRCSILQNSSRPLLTLGSAGSVEKSLKKSGNRSKINRLKRTGTLSFVQIRDRAEFERMIDTVVDFYDLRQGAISPSAPFHDDPYKREFTLRLIDRPNITHASVLLLDDVPIAVNIGLVSQASVSLGVFGYSPFYGASSPGRMHILLLAQYLGDSGFQQLDLTSGGDSYKDQMADHVDSVYVLSINFRRLSHALEMTRIGLRTLLKRCLSGETKSLVRKVTDFSSDPVGYLKAVTGRVAPSGQIKPSKKYLEIDVSDSAQSCAEPVLSVNAISDLLLYAPSGKQDLSRRAFFEYAWRRLEAGDNSYTYVRNGVLVHCAWLRQPGKRDGSGVGGSTKLSSNECLLWESFTHPGLDGEVIAQASLSQRIHDAAKLPGIERVIIETDLPVRLLSNAFPQSEPTTLQQRPAA